MSILTSESIRLGLIRAAGVLAAQTAINLLSAVIVDFLLDCPIQNLDQRVSVLGTPEPSYEAI